MPDGTFSYTRDGSFQMDNQGRIVTAEGNLVQPTITIPPNSTGLTINQQGQVSVTLPGSTTSSILGQFTLTTFINDAGLQANGDNLFVATPASGSPQDGTPGTQQRRHAAAGQPRAIECRGGDRDHQPDLGAARLRNEFQGHHCGRPDAADHRATDALRRATAMIRRSIRRLLVALPLAAGLLADPAAAQNAVPALRANVTVTGDVVHIGDLVENAGAVADVPIFRAPDLGTRGAVPTARVVEAIRPHQLIGIDTRGLAEVVVTRASRAIAAQEISACIAKAMEGQYGPASAQHSGRVRPRRAHAQRRI